MPIRPKEAFGSKEADQAQASDLFGSEEYKVFDLKSVLDRRPITRGASSIYGRCARWLSTASSKD